MALGAARGNVIWMVNARRVLLLVAIGVVAGRVVSLWRSPRVVQSQLFGLTPHDPLTLALATAALALVACAAGLHPRPCEPAASIPWPLYAMNKQPAARKCL